ncbi:PP2C family protein-serine/threonine phosphatase [Candidatus Gracilibacteria bacterium]|nr:PP2C family protein-serine/threonine phosphatase [Candidatus Gracilibacteria bacterium]
MPARRNRNIALSPSLLHHSSPHQVRRRRAVASVVTPNEAEQRRAAEIEQELQLARDIQQGLLLEAAPRIAGWELTALSLPARDLGGDLYDFLRLGEGWRGIMIGDVSGKGLPAALRMAVTRTVFRHEARRDGSAAETLARVNRGVLSEIPQGMVTMLYVRLHPHTGEIFLANAGHTYPLLINGSVQEIELSGLPLGVDDDSAYREACARLLPGETVMLYTDGVVEAENPQGEIFGFAQMYSLIAAHCHLKPRALVSLLLHELRSWTQGSGQSDDITMVVLRRRLSRLGDELRSIADDVLGPARAAQLWNQFGDRIAPHERDGEDWPSLLAEIGALAQADFGRGLSRELTQQLRLTIEEYRSADRD